MKTMEISKNAELTLSFAPKKADVCSIISQLYNEVAESLGYTPAEVKEYDCMKLCISTALYNAIRESFTAWVTDEYPAMATNDVNLNFASAWLVAGPKTTIEDNENFKVFAERGFITA